MSLASPAPPRIPGPRRIVGRALFLAATYGLPPPTPSGTELRAMCPGLHGGRLRTTTQKRGRNRGRSILGNAAPDLTWHFVHTTSLHGPPLSPPVAIGREPDRDKCRSCKKTLVGLDRWLH